MQNFADVCGFLAMNCSVIRRTALAVLSLVALSLPISAQQMFEPAPTLALYHPDVFATIDSSVLVRDLPVLAFLDGRLPGSSQLGRMGTAPVANFPLAWVSATPRQNGKSTSGPVKDPKDGKEYSSAESLAAEKASLVWTGGEIGVFYGRSTGRFGQEDFGSYIVGGVGNDKFQITVGGSYEQSTGRVPRWFR